MKNRIRFLSLPLLLFFLSACNPSPSSQSASAAPSSSQSSSEEGSSSDHRHSWGTPSYVWSDDLAQCTAKRVCTSDPTHEETETVDTNYGVIKEATCEKTGEAQYVAMFTNEAFLKQTKEITLPKLGHDWGEPTYEWDDEFHCTAKVVCQRDSSHVKTEKVGTLRETIVAPTKETKGSFKFTARFQSSLFATQEKTVELSLSEYTDLALTYQLNPDEKSYSVKFSYGYGLAEIEVPASYKGLPVTAVLRDGLTDAAIRSVILPDTITRLEGGCIDLDHVTKLVLSESLVEMDLIINRGRIAVTKENYLAYVGTRTNPYFCCVGGITYNMDARYEKINSKCKIINYTGYVKCDDKMSTLVVPNGIIALSPSALSGILSVATAGLVGKITLPKSLRYIGDAALIGSSNALTVEISEENTSYYVSEDGFVMTADGATIVFATAICQPQTLVIPASVKRIYSHVFRGTQFAKLSSIALPAEIILGVYSFGYIRTLSSFSFGKLRDIHGQMPMTAFYRIDVIENVQFQGSLEELMSFYKTDDLRTLFHKIPLTIHCTDADYEIN